MLPFLTTVHVVLVQNLFWWTVMCSSLAVLLTFFVITSLADVTMKTRSQWGAAPPTEKPTRILGPVAWVVVHQSAGNSDYSAAACGDVVKSIQRSHMRDRNWADIGYNFLVGLEGQVFEGRGWGVVGAHAPGYNNKSVGICIIGNYQAKAPSEAQLSAVKELIISGVKLGHITTDYKVTGHKQDKGSGCSGDKLYSAIQKWPKFASHME